MTDQLLNGKILVVGGAGFIGRHVLRAIRAAGGTPVGMDLVSPNGDLATIPWVTGSVSDPALFATAAAGCHSVVFLANSSLPNTANFDLAAEVGAHVQVTVKAAEICNDQGVKRFVFASSGGTVYGLDSEAPLREDATTLPRNAYGASKLAIEHYLRLIGTMRGMSTVSLRISNPYGEGQRALRNQGFIAAAMQHGVAGTTMPIWGDGTVERDFIYVSDVADAFVAALTATSPPTTFNIGSGEAVSLRRILQEIETVLGRPVPVAFEPGRIVDVKRNVLDVTYARNTLGWSPRVTLADGLSRTASWWLSL
jgi:UDP-glucose 4-epimerase